MVVVVVILAVVAAAAIVIAAVSGRRLQAQRRSAAAAEERVARQVVVLASATSELERIRRERAKAEERAETAEAGLEVAELEAREATERAAATETERDRARSEVEVAVAAGLTAEERAIAAERRAAAQRSGDGVGLDPQLLWNLEQSRSERTWRHSVAIGPESVSVFADTADPLVEALQVELDAAREDVGVVVELDAEVPPGVTLAGSVLVLRVAQEMLADVVRRSESTTLHVHADGADLLVSLTAVDEEDQPVEPRPLPLPPASGVAVTKAGVRVLDAIVVDGEA